MRRKKWHKIRKEQLFLFEPEAPKLTWIAHPRNDNERLLNAQADLVNAIRTDTPCAKEWQTLYTLAMKVARHFVAKLAKKYKKLAELTPDERQCKAHDAVMYIIEGYLADERFYITKSFTGYIYLRVRAELFNHSKADTLVDFVPIEDLTSIETPTL